VLPITPAAERCDFAIRGGDLAVRGHREVDEYERQL